MDQKSEHKENFISQLYNLSKTNDVKSRVSLIGQDHQRSVDVDKPFSCTKRHKTALGSTVYHTVESYIIYSSQSTRDFHAQHLDDYLVENVQLPIILTSTGIDFYRNLVGA